MFCSKCGKAVNEEDKFCENCGTEINSTKNSNSNSSSSLKKSKIITNIICVLVVVGFIGGIQLIVNNANKSSMEHGRSVVEGNLNNNNTTNKYTSDIKSKWKVTLPSNNTNGLECAVYNIEQQELYLKYNYGICSVNKNNEINRYVNGDLMNGTIQVLINNAKNGNSNYVYMTATEFEKIIK